MAREETLFHPIPQARKAGGGPAGPALRMEVDLDEERESLLETVTFAARAARRRKGLTFLVLALGLAMTLVAEYLAPRTYEVEARVLVLRSGMAVAIMGNNNGITPDEKRDAKEYEEQVKARSNIEAIVRDAKLVDHWDQNLTPIRRMIDEFGPSLGRPVLSEEAKFDTLVAVLEKQLKVNIDTSTVILSVAWPDPKLAHDIVHAAVEKFTAARYATEVGVIPQSITILENTAIKARAELDRRSSILNDVGHPGTAPAAAPSTGDPHDTIEMPEAPHAADTTHAAPGKPDPAVVARIAEIKAQVATIVAQRDQRLAQLNGQLSDMSTTYASAHPAVVALKATIDATRQDSPALVELRKEQSTLEAQAKATVEQPASAAPAPEAEAPTKKGARAHGGGPTGAFSTRTAEQRGEVQDRFESALRRLDNLNEKIDAAKILESNAKVDFNYRYQVVHPADFPTGPKSPVTLLVGVGGALLTMLLILLAAALTDLASGIFYEPRRVRDRLKLPVLGEAVAE